MADENKSAEPANTADAAAAGSEGAGKPADASGAVPAEQGQGGSPAKAQGQGGDAAQSQNQDAGTKPAADGADKAAGAAEKGAEVGAADADSEAAKAAKAAAEAAARIEWPKEGFPDDWRERVVASLKLEGDALKKAQEAAKRAAGPGELLRSVMASAGKIQEVNDELKKRARIPTGKDDKPEDLAAFDKAWGVPDSPEKYALPERPKDLGERTEEDIELLKPALERFQKAHFNQAQVAEMIRVMDETELTLARARADAAKAFDQASEDELRVEYGTPKDYTANIETANRVLQLALGKYMPEQADRTSLLAVTLDNGRKLGSYPGFIKFLVDIGRNGFAGVMDDGEFVEGEQAGAKSAEDRMREIVRLAHTGKPADEEEYKRLQPELMKLQERINRQNERRRA